MLVSPSSSAMPALALPVAATSTRSSPVQPPSFAPTALALAVLGPIAIGALLATRIGTPTPMFVVPAVVFGAVAATCPALYIATAAIGAAPGLAAVVRAFAIALGAFGIALGGLVLPATFLAVSAVDPATTVAVATGALGVAAVLALRRLACELDPTGRSSVAAAVVFVVWAGATLGIAGRLWWDLVREVLA